MKFEHWLFTAPLRLWSISRRRRIAQELDEELQFDLDHKIEGGIANGLTPEQARLAALRAMDGLEQKKEEAGDAALGGGPRDLRQGAPAHRSSQDRRD